MPQAVSFVRRTGKQGKGWEMSSDRKSNGQAKTGAARAFVAGATGYTGREVVRVLIERGVVTTAHIRPDSPDLDRWRERFTQMGAETDKTSWDEAAMIRTLSRLKPSIVFSLLGTTKARIRREARSGGDPKDAGYAAVDYGMTAMLIRAAMAAGSHPRFVYLSATGVSPRPKSEYYRSRWKAETDLQKSGLPYTIARPSFIVGPDRDEQRPFELVGARFLDASLSLAGALGGSRLRERYRSTTNTALANALVSLALDPEAEGAVFESEGLRD